MYGTIAKLKLKPGVTTDEIVAGEREFEGREVPGYVGIFIYRAENEPNTCYFAVAFESKEAYFANANSPEQQASFQKMMSYLAAEPEWHDGEIVYANWVK